MKLSQIRLITKKYVQHPRYHQRGSTKMDDFWMTAKLYSNGEKSESLCLPCNKDTYPMLKLFCTRATMAFVCSWLAVSNACANPTYNPTDAIKQKVKKFNSLAFSAYEADKLHAAVKYYSLAAGYGEPSALYNVAVMRIQDETQRPSLNTAINMLERSGNLGFANAQFMLGSLYETGLAIGPKRKSLQKSFDWMLKAAEQGHPDAILAVGTAYFLGRGTTLDYSNAAQWYTKAAQLGDAAAQYLIASMHESATGVPKDLEAALAWYVAAARQGDLAAREKSKYITELLAKERSS
jgi:uncharacterized protein